MRFINGESPIDLDFSHLVVAGWTGRDQKAIAHHIDELAALGVAPPSATPLYYRVAAATLTTAPRIEVVGTGSSGEVEPMVVQHGARRFLGLGSDHTDRVLEAHSVALSKQVCAKPCAAALWPWDEVEDRLDRLVCESWIFENGSWVAYQAGTLASIRPLGELAAGAGLNVLGIDGPVAMLCGTFGAAGGVRPARRFRMRLSDPDRARAIGHEYETIVLPEVA